MSRRPAVIQACQRCRHKRTKCDGNQPCDRCTLSGKHCEFAHDAPRTKSQLRGEISILRKENKLSLRLLGELAAMPEHEASSLLNLWSHSKQHPQTTAALAQLISAQGHPKQNVSDTASCERESASATSVSFSLADDIAGTNSDAALSSLHRASSSYSLLDQQKKQRPSTRDSQLSTSKDVQLSSQDTLLAATTASNSAAQPQLSSSDEVGLQNYSVNDIHCILAPYLAKDYLASCLIYKELFLANLLDGLLDYSSPALINALLALATRKQKSAPENHVHSNANATGCADIISTDDSSFCADAHRHFPNNPGLPDIQALGILALYYASCAQTHTAAALATRFATQTENYCRLQSIVDNRRTSTTAYCAAISLCRLLGLIDSTLVESWAFPAYSNTISADIQIALAPLINGGSESSNQVFGFISGEDPKQRKIMVEQSLIDSTGQSEVVAKLSRLIEMVYQTIHSTSASTAGIGSDRINLIPAVYRHCLNWYTEMIPLAGELNSCTSLFLHIQYHFCLLCLFRPLLQTKSVATDVYPDKVCRESAQSVLSLSHLLSQAFSAPLSFIPISKSRKDSITESTPLTQDLPFKTLPHIIMLMAEYANAFIVLGEW